MALPRRYPAIYRTIAVRTTAYLATCFLGIARSEKENGPRHTRPSCVDNSEFWNFSQFVNSREIHAYKNRGCVALSTVQHSTNNTARVWPGCAAHATWTCAVIASPRLYETPDTTHNGHSLAGVGGGAAATGGYTRLPFRWAKGSEEVQMATMSVPARQMSDISNSRSAGAL